MKLTPENTNIWLNSFIDGQLPRRERTELQRLLTNDPKLARRLLELKKCRNLLNALPRAEAPAGLFEDIKSALERKSLLGDQPQYFNERAGARHLFFRKLLTVAALLALFALLATVIYNIVAPEPLERSAIIASQPPATEETIARTESPAVESSMPRFHGSLVLETAAFEQLDALLTRAFNGNPLVRCVRSSYQRGHAEYTIAATRQGFDSLLAHLEALWDQLDSATLRVATDSFAETITVPAVTAQQLAEIVAQPSSQKCLQLARQYAALNTIASRLPGKTIGVALNTTTPPPLAIPQPRLTGSVNGRREPQQFDPEDAPIHLTIVLTQSH